MKDGGIHSITLAAVRLGLIAVTEILQACFHSFILFMVAPNFLPGTQRSQSECRIRDLRRCEDPSLCENVGRGVFPTI